MILSKAVYGYVRVSGRDQNEDRQKMNASTFVRDRHRFMKKTSYCKCAGFTEMFPVQFMKPSLYRILSELMIKLK